jgi:hypothetical protein
MQNLLSNFAEVRKLTVDGTAKATQGVDMANHDGVMFLVLSGSASLTVQAQQAASLSNSLLSDADDIGAVIPSSAIDSGDTILVDIYRPTGRYVGLEFSDAAHVTAVWAIRYHARVKPVDNSADAHILLQLISPEVSA